MNLTKILNKEKSLLAYWDKLLLKEEKLEEASLDFITKDRDWGLFSKEDWDKYSNTVYSLEETIQETKDKLYSTFLYQNMIDSMKKRFTL